jgi:3',5'-cyclic AMP phosphodiesterase CpdA
MRLAHISDLHFGHHDEQLATGLAAELRGGHPDLVVISGDFTQVGSAEEFARARAFIDSVGIPVFAVPGNHDVPQRPIDLPRRFLNPYSFYRRYIAPETEPFLQVDGVALAGVKTSRRMRLELNWSHGSISRDQLEDLERRFSEATPDAVRVVVAHHPLMQPEGPTQSPTRTVDRANRALATFARIGVRLVLSGHFHLSYVRKHEHPGAIREGEPPGPREAAAAPVLVAQASSTISTRLRGEPNSYNLIDIARGEIDISVREWTGERWATREKEIALAELPAVAH